jgi:HPt (histidine-containing phosphotransfer) domain-containing protein
MEKAESALAVQDAAELCKCVHSLNGSAANFGANTLVGLCGRLESHCLSGELKPAPALLTAIYQELAKVREDLLKYRAHPTKAPSFPN